MAEERLEPSSITPLSETDLAPIEPLTPRAVLTLGQRYVEASFNRERLVRKVDRSAEGVDGEIIWELQYQTGRLDAYREVLEELGQDKLIATVDTKIKKMFEQS